MGNLKVTVGAAALLVAMARRGLRKRGRIGIRELFHSDVFQS